MTEPSRPLRLPATVAPKKFRVLFVGAEPAIVDIHDGDTMRMVLVCDSVSGVGIWPWLRLSGCDAPELGTEAGAAAQQWMVTTLSKARQIEVELAGWSFDRRVAKVWVDGHDLTTLIIGAGHAVPWAPK